jgi:hypothetical protein
MGTNAHTQREKIPCTAQSASAKHANIRGQQRPNARGRKRAESKTPRVSSKQRTAAAMRFSLGAHYPTARKISLSATQKGQGTKRQRQKIFSAGNVRTAILYITSCYLPVSKCVMQCTCSKRNRAARGRDKSSFITTRLLSCELMEAHSHSASASDNTLPQSPGTGQDLKTS